MPRRDRIDAKGYEPDPGPLTPTTPPPNTTGATVGTTTP
jgi:hypothetical protein